MITETLYPELKEPVMSFSQIFALLAKLTDEELETLNEEQFASALFTLYH
jgi:hypothetical protein